MLTPDQIGFEQKGDTLLPKNALTEACLFRYRQKESPDRNISTEVLWLRRVDYLRRLLHIPEIWRPLRRPRSKSAAEPLLLAIEVLRKRLRNHQRFLVSVLGYDCMFRRDLLGVMSVLV